jgi:ADP-heptose:LPS heptosyltransferase
MNPRTIKTIDFWCGVPLCFVVTFYEKIRRAITGRRRDDSPPRKMLFLKLTEQGAIVLAYPALRRAVEAVGRSNVWFCVFPEYRPILDLLDVVPRENVIEIRHTSLRTFLYDAARFFLRARRLGIDTVIDLEFFSRASALLCYLSGSSKRAGYHRYTSEYPYRGDLMTHRVQYNPYLHTSHGCLLLVEAVTLGLTDPPLPKIRRPQEPLPRPRFSPSESQRQRVATLLRAEARRDLEKPFILVNANAGDMLPIRRWDQGRFVQLIRELLATYDRATVLLTGSPSERRAVDDMCRSLPSDRIVNLAGKTDLTDLVTLYSMADVLVTNDSGPGHFAALTDLDCVVLFGPETPQLFAPLGDAVHVVYEALACSPCVNVFNHRFSPCTNNVCMSAISVARVLGEVREILAARGYAQNR